MESEQPPKHPGRVLLEDVMEPLGVSRARLARDIDVSTARINGLLAGKRSMTPDLALRLATHFGTSAELWLKLQADYDLMQLRAGPWRAIEPRIRVFSATSSGAPTAFSEAPESAAEPEPAPSLPADPARFEPERSEAPAPSEPDNAAASAPFEPYSEASFAFSPHAGSDPAPVSEAVVTEDTHVANPLVMDDNVIALSPAEIDSPEPLELTELVDADELAVLDLTECVDASASGAPEPGTTELDIPDPEAEGARRRAS